ncbi:MAG TPA: GMC oxidoreductase [Acidimicrobiales bacterium]
MDPSLTFTPDPVEYLIIGSGFGGAVTALRLSEAGLPSVLLERGRRWPLTPYQDTFSSLTNPDGRSAWLSDVALLGDPKPIDRFVGVLELTVGDGIVAFAGAGVGGGSLVYAGALVQPPESLFRRIFGTGVDYGEMDDVHYPRVRSVMQPEPIPLAVLARPEYAAARAWVQLGREAGLPTELIDMGIDWRIVEAELAGRRVPSVIAGDFWYGNNSGAKLSLDRNYLRRAEATGLLTLETQQNVASIQEGPDGRYLVTADEIADDGTVLRTRRYLARRLFLGAGSLGTSKLLVRSRARGWLPRLNDRVGSAWGNNGDFFSAISGLPSRVRPNLGGTAPILVRDLDNPILPTGVECFADWAREGSSGVVASVGMAPVPAKGTFRYDEASDSVRLVWPGSDPDVARAVRAGELTYARLAAGDRSRRPHRVEPVAARAFGSGGAEPAPVDAAATAHPLGGVPLDAATDNIGTVRGYPGLYVMDGALVPGHAGCSNPALTIAALAERNIERILERDLG